MEDKPEVKRKFHVVEASLVRKSSQLYSSRMALVIEAGWRWAGATLQRLVSEPMESGEVK